MMKILRLICILLCLLVCNGCIVLPVVLVKQLDSIEESKIKDDSTHKRIYLSRSNRIANADDFFTNFAKQVESNEFADTVNQISPAEKQTEVRSVTTYKDTIRVFVTPTPDKKPLELRFEIIGVDDTDYPEEIRLRALAYDTEGKYISGLAPPYLQENREIRDYWKQLSDSCENINHYIEDFKVTEIREKDARKHAIAFALDHSPSMGAQKIIRLQIAVQRLLRAIKPGDAIAIAKFDAKLHTEVDLTYDISTALREFIVDSGQADKYGGGTALFDAVNHCISLLNKADDSYKKVLIAFSDGQDNSSTSKIDSVLRYANASNVEIYSIAYGAADKTLETMAEYTGGRMYRTLSSKEFPFIFRDIYLLLKNYYLISYKPPVCENLHTVSVYLGSADDKLLFKAQGQYDKSLFRRHSPVGTIAMLNIEFDFGSDKINPESSPLVDRVADAMLNNPNMKILITGHTDDIGSEESNIALSLRRAESVKNAIITKGINPGRIHTKGLGEGAPLVVNNSEENRRINRRTEFTIIEN